jgi:hypothetical protein
MKDKQLTAFLVAYGSNVAHTDRETVKDILEDLDNAYEKHPCEYGSVLDALGMFEAGIAYAKENLCHLKEE